VSAGAIAGKPDLAWRTLTVHLGATALNQLAGRGASALLAISIARSLGAAGQGELTLASAVVDVGCVLGALGLQQSNSHHVAEDRARLPALLGNSLVVSGVLTAVGVVGAVAFYGASGAPLAKALVVCALLAIPVSTVSQLLLGLMWGLSDVREANLLQLGQSLLPLLPVAIAVRFGLLTPAVALLATTGGLLIPVLGSAWLLVRRHHARPQLSRPLLTASLSYGVRWCANSFLLMMLDKSLFFLVAALRGSADVAYMWVAMGTSDALQLLPAAAASVLLPRLSKLETPAERYAMANRVGRWLTGVMAAEAFALALLMKWVVPTFFGAAYAPAITGCIVLLVAFISEGMGRAQYLFLAASRRHALALYGSLAGGGAALAVCWALVPRYGTLGAVFGVATGQLVTALAITLCAQVVMRDAAPTSAVVPR
jgi:O-antigen/teichoic acid export membrane protein